MTTRRHVENAVSFPRRPGVSRAGDAAFRPRPSSRSGSALVFAIGCFFFLFVLVLSVYSVGETIRRKTELQNACDAAAYSAAVVQADALSRMAVLNRAMAWSYIQTTKMQMDYIAYKWLRHVRDCFEEDMKNIWPTGMAEFGKPGMGYHHFGEELNSKNHEEGIWMSFGFDCKHGIHDKKNDIRARYIGLGPNTEYEGLEVGEDKPLPDKHWIRINGHPPRKTRLEYRNGDLDLVLNGRRIPQIVSTLEKTFGEDGKDLKRGIENGKELVDFCSGMLARIWRDMPVSMTAAAETAIKANLPHRPDGTVDKTVLEDYAFAVNPGVSPTMPYPESENKGYFDPLRNCEEDEIRFLSMADGLPGGDDRFALKDFFGSSTPGLDIAAGLDQWFIRADSAEFNRDDAIAVERNWVPAPEGIQRCYKTANYAEGQYRRPGKKEGVIRGNFTLDGDEPVHPTRFPPVVFSSGLPMSLYEINWTEPHKSPRRLEWEKEREIVYEFLDKTVDDFRFDYETKMGLSNAFMAFFPSPDPSCINFRNRFFDKCANTSETWGLVAEYEWASAYWFCFHVEFKKFLFRLNRLFCFHIPFPSALWGGAAGNSYAGKNPQSPLDVFSAQQKPFGAGSSRADYRRTFIGGDAEPTFNCLSRKEGANMGVKGYARIYGDDREILQDESVRECYVGPKAMPWMLNQRYFNGMGTTVVGLARKQKNVFHWIEGKLGRALGLYDAFSPDIRVKDGKGMIVKDKEGNDQSAGAPHLVAFSAARAAWAPRSGRGSGEGSDSEDDPRRGKWGGKWGRHYELRYDTVTDGEDGNFTPHLHPNAPNGESLSKEARLGCPCGQPETGRRLRRQWNLCQTDWDAVLLPVRHSFAVPSHVAGSSPASDPADFDSGDDPEAGTTWSFREGEDDSDPQYKLFGEPIPRRIDTVVPEMTWHRFTDDGKSVTDEKYDEIVLKPQNMSVNDAYLLFKKRMIH